MNAATAKNNMIPFGAIQNEMGINAAENSLPRMKTIKEVSELTGLPYSLLRNLCIQKKITYFRTGKKYLINYDKFIDFLNTGENA